MKKIGVVGLGNMGMGIAKNLVKNGYDVTGFDLKPDNMKALAGIGGNVSPDIASMGSEMDIVFVMVVNAKQAHRAVCGEKGLAAVMKPGSTVVVTATIGKTAVEAIEARLAEKRIHLVDSPVSGGQKGADTGELTLMLSCGRERFEEMKDVFEAIAKNVNHVGEKPGTGQVVKACLQGLVGCIYAGIFEMMVLGAKAGVRAETLHSVIGTSVANTPLFQGSVPAIMARNFAGTGSTIDNTYKDLTITMDLAEECGVPAATTAMALQFFQSGVTKFPGEDNQCLVKILEDIVGIEVK